MNSINIILFILFAIGFFVLDNIHYKIKTILQKNDYKISHYFDFYYENIRNIKEVIRKEEDKERKKYYKQLLIKLNILLLTIVILFILFFTNSLLSL